MRSINIKEYKDSPRVNYLSYIEGPEKRVVKTFTVVHKISRYLLIYYKISFVNVSKQGRQQLFDVGEGVFD